MMKDWIDAIRVRTLPLALASVAMGAILAADHNAFVLKICLWSAVTTLLLQVLSNLANDYGDTVHGADHHERRGPARAVQSGRISARDMRIAIVITAALSFASGLYLLSISDLPQSVYLIFLALGVLAILAAVLYTNGFVPYGYIGLGDLFVFLFFGLLAVTGTYYLQATDMKWDVLLPAASVGFFTVAVLNINNMRDIESDILAGKRSLPVRLGQARSVIYHGFLLTSGFISALAYVAWNWDGPRQLIFLLVLPLLIQNFRGVKKDIHRGQLDPYLKKMSLSTLVFVVLFGVSVLV